MKSDHQVRRIALALSFMILVALPSSAGTVRIYITNSAGDRVDVIDSATNKVVQVISRIEVPHGVNFSPDGKRVYISNESARVLDVVDEKSGSILKKVPLSGPSQQHRGDEGRPARARLRRGSARRS